jgi:hypothetical protein
VEKKNMMREREREREREKTNTKKERTGCFQRSQRGKRNPAWRELLPEKSAGKRNPRSHATAAAAADDKERRDATRDQEDVPRTRNARCRKSRARFFFDFSRTL